MQKHLKQIYFMLLSFVLSIAVCTAPASAAGGSGFGASSGLDAESVQAWDSVASRLLGAPGLVQYMIAHSGAAGASGVFWYFVDGAMSTYGEVTLPELRQIANQYTQYFSRTDVAGFFPKLEAELKSYLVNGLSKTLGFGSNLNFVAEKHPSSGFWRIRETTNNLWIVNSMGRYPCALGSGESATSGGAQWIGERSASTAQVNMVSEYTLSSVQAMLIESGVACQIKPLGTKYKAIWRDRTYYCDSDGRPYVCWAEEDKAAINQERPATSVVDGDGNTVVGDGSALDNSTTNNIDLSGMTITLPDGTVQIADAVIYDESTKTYNIDSHDTYNTFITYNYSWTYHINYTSITYIGQTAEYDKYYEGYYELPDGRDSADLTAEELEQLDFNLDVVPYGRSADDTSLRSLYHFDGDTSEESYWNYCTDFQWNSGASLTYMDVGVFNGALYLDENAHNFTMTLPSNIGKDDFTMSFRYYQSRTEAPQTDSSIQFRAGSDVDVFKFNGGYFLNGSGSQLSVTPTGTWNEIAFVRQSGSLYYYLNGVKIGSVSDSTFYYNKITFDFGSAQQTFKYFDEFRFVNRALTSGGANYTCSAVPYDTNLSLVLPDSMLPVADEYWDFDTTIKPTKSADLTSLTGSPPLYVGVGGRSIITPFQDFVRLSPTADCKVYALFTLNNGAADVYVDNYLSPYTFSLVTISGEICSISSTGLSSNNNTYQAYFDWGYLSVGYSYTNDAYRRCYYAFDIRVYPGQKLDLIYYEVVPGDTPNTGHEYVTAITPVVSYEKPTLAVRTDVPITSKQIGGARPSVPTKGLVWAMVESGVIRSLQIYNGSAWEACDGRIFTGKRWVPYSGYNIITMKDFYDVVDASGNDYEYIYSETGFWSWWQKSWNAFTAKLFAALGAGGAGGSVAPGSVQDVISNALTGLIDGLFKTVAEVLKTLLSLLADLLSFVFDFLTDSILGAVKAFFAAFKDNSLFDFFQQPPVISSDGTQTDGGYGLPDEVGTGFAFISGVIMVLPPDLRSILFFALGIMVLLGVLKLVKS